jgi:hypothetical protein
MPALAITAFGVTANYRSQRAGSGGKKERASCRVVPPSQARALTEKDSVSSHMHCIRRAKEKTAAPGHGRADCKLPQSGAARRKNATDKTQDAKMQRQHRIAALL